MLVVFLMCVNGMYMCVCMSVCVRASNHLNLTVLVSTATKTHIIMHLCANKLNTCESKNKHLFSYTLEEEKTNS